MNQKLKVLYVDDEGVNLLAFKANFRRDYHVITAESAAQAIDIMANETPDVVLADQRMPEMTGVEFFEKIRKTHPYSIRILLTGFSDIEAVIAAINKGQVYGYATKPWVKDDLVRTIEGTRSLVALRRRNDQIRNNYQQLFELSSDAILLINNECKPVGANSAALNSLGQTHDALLSMSATDLFPIADEIRNHLKSGQKLNGTPVSLRNAEGLAQPFTAWSSTVDPVAWEDEPLQVILRPV